MGNIFRAIYTVFCNIRGEVNSLNGENQAVIAMEEIEIDGILYRITAEFKDNIRLDKTVSEWAMKKAIEEIRSLA